MIYKYFTKPQKNQQKSPFLQILGSPYKFYFLTLDTFSQSESQFQIGD